MKSLNDHAVGGSPAPAGLSLRVSSDTSTLSLSTEEPRLLSATPLSPKADIAPADGAFLARLGGDEFTLVATTLVGNADAAEDMPNWSVVTGCVNEQPHKQVDGNNKLAPI